MSVSMKIVPAVAFEAFDADPFPVWAWACASTGVSDVRSIASPGDASALAVPPAPIIASASNVLITVHLMSIFRTGSKYTGLYLVGSTLAIGSRVIGARRTVDNPSIG